MKKIPLTQGKFAIVDDADFSLVSKYKWYACKNRKQYYAYHTLTLGVALLMHRLILGLKPNDGTIVDHINRNPLDNRRENLRVCTHSINTLNSVRGGNKVGYRGVRPTYNNKYIAAIGFKMVVQYLGTFETAKDAAIAYRKRFIELHGEANYLLIPSYLRIK